MKAFIEKYKSFEQALIVTRLNEYRRFFESFNKIHTKKAEQNSQETKKIIKKYDEFLKDIYKKEINTAPNFNPFILLKLEGYENTHSDVLAWVLDSCGTHSQGNTFFKAFISLIPRNIDYDLENYKVRREVSGEESRIDIRIYSRNFMFDIENKVSSPEGDKQTHREYSDLIKKAKSMNVKEENLVFIFLTPAGIKAENEKFLPISYNQLADAMEKTIDLIKADNIKHFISAWIKSLRNVGGQYEIF